jgi:hypothetical protein
MGTNFSKSPQYPSPYRIVEENQNMFKTFDYEEKNAKTFISSVRMLARSLDLDAPIHFWREGEHLVTRLSDVATTRRAEIKIYSPNTKETAPPDKTLFLITPDIYNQLGQPPYDPLKTMRLTTYKNEVFPKIVEETLLLQVQTTMDANITVEVDQGALDSYKPEPPPSENCDWDFSSTILSNHLKNALQIMKANYVEIRGDASKLLVQEYFEGGKPPRQLFIPIFTYEIPQSQIVNAFLKEGLKSASFISPFDLINSIVQNIPPATLTTLWFKDDCMKMMLLISPKLAVTFWIHPHPY